MKASAVLLVLVCIAACLIIAGCTTPKTAEKELPPLITPTTPATTVPAVTTTVTTVPTQAYKSVDLAITLPNVYPVYGFRMDYPADWSYKQERTGSWRAGYNFSSPDKKSRVYVYVDDTSGTAYYWYPLRKWANNVIRELITPYCLDNSANPIECPSSANAREYHRRYVASDDAVVIQGAFEARRIIFKSDDDPHYGEETVYVLHAGKMQGYNFTVPDHYEIGVKVDGPVWDYSVGGQGYLIDFYAPADQVDSTREIFTHMINSFRVTP